MRRVGFNLLYLVPGEVGGTEVYARELLQELCRTVDAVVYCGPEARAQPWPGGARVVVAPVPSRIKPLRILAELTWLPARLRRDGVELLHSLGTTAPVLCPVPSVVTIHDVIYHQVPESFPAASRLGLELLVPAAARRAACLIADSRAARDDVCAVLGVPAGRFVVAPLGVVVAQRGQQTPARELRARLELGDAPVVLCVSAALPHKNLGRLIAAFAGVAGAELVVVGHRGRERLSGERVRFTGWVSRADLEGLYALASVFVYPSLVEGFGMPILEAMARGLPVACSDIPALREVGGDAVERFDPRASDDIAAALRRLLGDAGRRAELVALGRERARAFTWERCARDTLAAYERALA